MKIDLLFEAKTIASTLNDHDINWAFVGGIAVGIYGYVRATDDIDILIEKSDLITIDDLLENLGFIINESPMSFSDGYQCHRRLKFFDDRSYFILDLLAHPTASPVLLKNKIKGTLDDTPSYVIHKSDLMTMKKRANRPKDLIDIENLKDEK